MPSSDKKRFCLLRDMISHSPYDTASIKDGYYVTILICLTVIFCYCTYIALRAAVQAFRREEELQIYRVSKRRRERFDQVLILYTLDISKNISLLKDCAVSVRQYRNEKNTPSISKCLALYQNHQNL